MTMHLISVEGTMDLGQDRKASFKLTAFSKLLSSHQVSSGITEPGTPPPHLLHFHSVGSALQFPVLRANDSPRTL